MTPLNEAEKALGAVPYRDCGILITG